MKALIDRLFFRITKHGERALLLCVAYGARFPYN